MTSNSTRLWVLNTRQKKSEDPRLVVIIINYLFSSNLVLTLCYYMAVLKELTLWSRYDIHTTRKSQIT